MWELKHKDGWALKNWWFRTLVLEKTLESPMDCKEIKPVNPKGNQSWIFIGRTDAEAETPILWPPVEKSWLNGKDLDAGKDWRLKKKMVAEDKMVVYHHQFMDMNFGKLQEIVRDRKAWHAAVHGVTKGQIWMSNWTSTTEKFTDQWKFLFSFHMLKLYTINADKKSLASRRTVPVRFIFCVWEMLVWEFIGGWLLGLNESIQIKYLD